MGCGSLKKVGFNMICKDRISWLMKKVYAKYANKMGNFICVVRIVAREFMVYVHSYQGGTLLGEFKRTIKLRLG